MSQWLQVAAIARIDDFRFEPVSVEEATKRFEKVFGKECSWETGDFDDAFEHPERYLPMGSEGSLKMSVYVNPHVSSMDSYTVSIFGSLRDVDIKDAENIIDWFKDKISSLPTRNAVIDVGVGFVGHKVWVYTSDSKDSIVLVGESKEKEFRTCKCCGNRFVLDNRHRKYCDNCYPQKYYAQKKRATERQSKINNKV